MFKLRQREKLIVKLRLYQQTVIDLLPHPNDQELEDMFDDTHPDESIMYAEPPNQTES